MNLKLNQKDIRALKLGAIGVAAIFVFVFASQGISRWKQARESFETLQDQLDSIDLNKVRSSGLLRIVPVFQMPVDRETQRFLFRDTLAEQLASVGINSEPLQEQTGGKTPMAGYELLRMKCSGTCRFDQILELLAALKENPYLVGIEEMRITVQTDNQQQRAGLRGVQQRGSTRGTQQRAGTRNQQQAE